MELVRVDFMGVMPGGIGPVQTVKIGSGAAKMRLMAGSDLIVISAADSSEWQPQVEFSGEMPPPPDGFADGVGPDFSHFYSHGVQRVEAAMRRANFVSVAVERDVVGYPLASAASPMSVNEPVIDGERLVVL